VVTGPVPGLCLGIVVWCMPAIIREISITKPSKETHMTVRLQSKVVDWAAFYKQEHSRAEAAGTCFDPLEMQLRADDEVCVYKNNWGEEWTLQGGTENLKISRFLGRGKMEVVYGHMKLYHPLLRMTERDPMELGQETKKAEQYYKEWLGGQHNESTRIIPLVGRPGWQEPSRNPILPGVANDPHNPAASIGLKTDPGPMDWGDKAGYVPSPAQAQKRDTLEKNVRSALAERRYSMDTIATAAGCDREYVRQISKHFCTPEEHKVNLKREDS
jgi:hypothetical protein